MKLSVLFATIIVVTSASCTRSANSKASPNLKKRSLFIDQHDLVPGKITFADVGQLKSTSSRYFYEILVTLILIFNRIK